MQIYKICLKFTEPLLGGVPKDRELYASYLQNKVDKSQKVERELKTVEEIEEKNWTGFHMLNGKPILYDYVIKGFFKDACSMLRRDTKSESYKLKAHKRVIDGLIFVFPRMIEISTNGGEMGVLERSLRAQTAQGERITLARSDLCPAGSEINIEIRIIGGVSKKLLKEWLGYGQLRGIGQWRNGSYGRFEYSMR